MGQLLLARIPQFHSVPSCRAAPQATYATDVAPLGVHVYPLARPQPDTAGDHRVGSAPGPRTARLEALLRRPQLHVGALECLADVSALVV
jgi:hypothetical protein